MSLLSLIDSNHFSDLKIDFQYLSDDNRELFFSYEKLLKIDYDSFFWLYIIYRNDRFSSDNILIRWYSDHQISTNFLINRICCTEYNVFDTTSDIRSEITTSYRTIIMKSLRSEILQWSSEENLFKFYVRKYHDSIDDTHRKIYRKRKRTDWYFEMWTETTLLIDSRS